MNTIRLSAPLQLDSLVDGDGLRMVLWCQGCDIKCPKCHNPETWDKNKGILYHIDDIKTQIYKLKDKYDGITLSGGHPFMQIDGCLEIAKFCKSIGLNIWIYSGYTYEEIIRDSIKLELLKQCNVLVDGAYIDSLRRTTLKFRGSSNQRVIDVQKSLKENKVILWCD